MCADALLGDVSAVFEFQVLRPVFHSSKQDACHVKDPLTGSCDASKRQRIPSEINRDDDVDVKDTLP